VTHERAFKWDLAPLPPTTFCSNVVMTGTGAPDPGRVYLKQGFVQHGCGAISQGGVHWVIETPDSIPALRSTSAHVLIWHPGGADAGNPWRRILQVMYGAGTSSVAPATHGGTHSAGRMRADRLAQIQAAFGFTLQDLAQVLGVSRAQLYKWLDPEREVQLHGESRARFNQIAQLASEWRTLSAVPLSTVAHEPVLGGTSIVSLMAEPNLDVSLVTAALRELADRTASITPSVTEGLRQRGFRRRPSARSLPSDA
jgi:hypothetical protein